MHNIMVYTHLVLVYNVYGSIGICLYVCLSFTTLRTMYEGYTANKSTIEYITLGTKDF